jgi:hypothetical protein
MKTSTKTAIAAGAVAVIGTLLLAGASQAGSGGDCRGRPFVGGPGMFGPPDMLDAFDANADGRLTQAEIDAALTERFAKYDSNGDGALSVDEFEGLFTEVARPMIVRAYQRLDPDGDAAVTADEFERPFANIVKRHDRDGDGALSKDDWRRGHRRHWDDDRDDDWHRGHRRH